MVYVMSDIHGNLRRFRSVMRQIELQPEDVLYVLGDVMDRFPDGVTILRELMATPNAQLLLGNHEYMMLQVMDPETIRTLSEAEKARTLPRWYRNGGEVTKLALEALDRKTREEIIAFVRALPLYYELEVNGRRFRLIHAAPPELYPAHEGEYGSLTEFAVWHRWPFVEPFPFETDATFVFGHTPTCYFRKGDPLRIFSWENRIGIDCGSCFPERERPHGRLACLRLDDMREFYSEEDI